MGGVLRSTVVPFAIVLVVAGVVGWVIQHSCPAAVSLSTAVRGCVLRR
jgi:hypothetical protein